MKKSTIHSFLILTVIFVSASAIVGPTNSTKTVIVKPLKTDTYLEAYSKSRIDAETAKQGVIIVTPKDGQKDNKVNVKMDKKIANREDSFSGYDYSPYTDTSSNYQPANNFGAPVKFETDITYNTPTNSYGPPANNYGPPANNYGAPANNYGPPANNYGPPANNYGPPANNYGPPANNYGPPAQLYPAKPLPVYGPPRPSYGVPYTAPSLGFLEKFAFKLDILTIAKLMLKFLIFKKIVTMIAVICMLLVIPKLIHLKKDAPGPEGDEDRKFQIGNHMIELNSIQAMFDRAVAVYSRQQENCGVICRVRHVIDDMYQFQPYYRQGGER